MRSPDLGEVAQPEVATRSVISSRKSDRGCARGGNPIPAWASAAVAGDLVYVPRLDGTLQAMRASSGKVEWKMYLGDSTKAGVVPATPPAKRSCGWDVQGGNAIHAPAALGEDGRLFVGTDEGVLFAIGN